MTLCAVAQAFSMAKVQLLIDTLAAALSDAAKVNKSVQTAPAAVLWTDAERQWGALIPRLRDQGLSIVSLDEYVPGGFQGPAIWLKCAVAGTLDHLNLSGAPIIVYLPGVSRTDLRAIESCPRELQPLAELQYRGVFWSQVNGKDWTVNAFLSTRNGGLGLDVAQDKATSEALIRVLEAGVLFDHALDELRGRHVDAAWLDGLLAPNPARDLLVWLNDPQQVQAQWAGAHWSVFLKRCKADFGFNPVNEGALVAAEKLSQAKGAWAAVWELYRDSYTRFPKIADALAKVQPPNKGLFDGWSELSGYPRANEDAENALRYQLVACGVMPPSRVRQVVADLFAEHECRQGWLWARMGRSPLVNALFWLAKLAEASVHLVTGVTLDQMAQRYRLSGWVVDDAALRAMASVQTHADSDAVSAVLRALYVPWLGENAQRFQDLVKASGALGTKPTEPSEFPAAGLCTVFVDGLRYDIALRLMQRLEALGKTELDLRWSSLPSVTASGKAWCSPVAHLIAGSEADINFEPCVAASGKPLSSHHFRKLLLENGIQTLEKHELGDPSGQAWVECGDLDHYGHEHGLRLARDIETQLGQILERVEELVVAGWQRFQIVTDHGWLLVPGDLPKSELSMHQAETRWGRCAVIKDSAHGTSLTFGWDWCKDVQVAFAPGITNFVAGTSYAHGGLSLQECLVPVLKVEVASPAVAMANVSIQSLSWKGLRCAVEITPDLAGLKADIRSKATQASSSLAANVKPIEGGKVSLAVADDDQLGAAAVVVVLDADGNVVQKMATTIGG